MTHEFKTPLSSILIVSKFLSRHTTITADEKLHRYSQIIIEQGKKLDGHLEKILNVAKTDNNPEVLQKTSVDMFGAVSNAIEIIQLKHADAKIEFNSNGEKITILADEFHFTNIVYNFLDNAVKYCNKKPFIKIDLREDKKYTWLQIQDNGIGIAPKH